MPRKHRLGRMAREDDGASALAPREGKREERRRREREGCVR